MSFLSKIFGSKSNDEKKDIELYERSLKKSANSFSLKFKELFSSHSAYDDDFFEELEEVLILSDIGVEQAIKLVSEIRTRTKELKEFNEKEIIDIIVSELLAGYMVGSNEYLLNEQEDLSIYFFVGVNGNGKTTTIGKLAYKLKKEGKKVLLAAGDTFRAGAVKQLEQWADRIGVDVVSLGQDSDPSAVMYTAAKKAKDENYDVLLCDTSGRLQNKVNLMKELEKMVNTVKKHVPNAPHEVLLVIDSTTGQNGLSQAQVFKDSVKVSGIVLTKLDGTAKGGTVFSVKEKLDVPVKLVGLGEREEDLKVFNLGNFVYSLFQDLF